MQDLLEEYEARQQQQKLPTPPRPPKGVRTAKNGTEVMAVDQQQQQQSSGGSSKGVGSAKVKALVQQLAVAEYYRQHLDGSSRVPIVIVSSLLSPAAAAASVGQLAAVGDAISAEADEVDDMLRLLDLG
jgi:hypothetical protein